MTSFYQQQQQDGERVQLAMAGLRPIIAVNDKDLGIVLDAGNEFPITDEAFGASLSLRHAASQFFRVQEGRETWIHGNEVTASIYAGSQRDSRMKIGPAAVNFQDNVVIDGSIAAGKYVNLIDDFESYDIFAPPTAHALSRAFMTLSNMLKLHIGPDPPDPEDTSLTDAMYTGPVLCTDLYVTRGGSINCMSYCNLVHDYRIMDMTLPASSFALNSAYVSLSNQISISVAAALAGAPPMFPVQNLSTSATLSDIRSATGLMDQRIIFEPNGTTVFKAPLKIVAGDGSGEVVAEVSSDGRITATSVDAAVSAGTQKCCECEKLRLVTEVLFKPAWLDTAFPNGAPLTASVPAGLLGNIQIRQLSDLVEKYSVGTSSTSELYSQSLDFFVASMSPPGALLLDNDGTLKVPPSLAPATVTGSVTVGVRNLVFSSQSALKTIEFTVDYV